MTPIINFHYGHPRDLPVASKRMTVYDGAVRIQGKDGRRLHPWRVVYHRPGFGLSYTTVTAEDGVSAADRALALSDRRHSESHTS
jgi:hypothetical protein